MGHHGPRLEDTGCQVTCRVMRCVPSPLGGCSLTRVSSGKETVCNDREWVISKRERGDVSLEPKQLKSFRYY